MRMLLAAAVCAAVVSSAALAQEKMSKPTRFDYIVYLAPDHAVHGRLCRIPPEVTCKGGPLLQVEELQTAAGLQSAPGGS